MHSGHNLYREHKQMYDVLALDMLDKWGVQPVNVPVKYIEVPPPIRNATNSIMLTN